MTKMEFVKAERGGYQTDPVKQTVLLNVFVDGVLDILKLSREDAIALRNALDNIMEEPSEELDARTGEENPVNAGTEQIKARAQSIKEATDYLLDNIPDTLYGALGAVNWAAVHCDEVYWSPATDEYLVQVAKANSAELAVYLRAELSRQGYETEVITEW